MRRETGVDDPDRLFVQLHDLKMVAAIAARGTITGAGRDLCRSSSVVTREVGEVDSVLRHLLHDGRKLLLLVHLADARPASSAAGATDMTRSGVSMAILRAPGMRTDAGAKLILRARRMRVELLPRSIGACLDRAPGGAGEGVEAPGETLIARLPAGEIDMVPTVPGSQFDTRKRGRSVAAPAPLFAWQRQRRRRDGP